jgi:enoyl-CoA hydratase/carnithine racemase
VSSLLRGGTRHGFDTVEIDSPANRNALSVELLQALREEVRRSAAGTGRGLLVHHTGPAFCSGVDLKERKALGPADASHSVLLAELLREMWHYPKPVVASVDGAVRGGGLGVLACADIVLATARSTFAYSESRVGVAPALVMAVTLPLASTRTLMPRLLDGAAFDAASAQELGLVGRIIDGDEAVDGVLAELCQGAPEAQAAIKRLARKWSEVDMDGLIEEMTALSADLFAAPEAAEGVAAFASKRSPSWAVTS